MRRLCFYSCLSVHRGVSASVHAGIPPPTPPGTRHPPWSRYTHPGTSTPPPEQTHLPPGPGPLPRGSRHPHRSRRLLLRTVRILLECIPVFHNICHLFIGEEIMENILPFQLSVESSVSVVVLSVVVGCIRLSNISFSVRNPHNRLMSSGGSVGVIEFRALVTLYYCYVAVYLCFYDLERFSHVCDVLMGNFPFIYSVIHAFQSY